MPDGHVTDSTKAKFRVIDENEDRIHSYVAHANQLSGGINTLAASIHQRTNSSSDCSFLKALKTAQIYNNDWVSAMLKIKYVYDFG